ncbi:PspC domain-containing protein [Sporolactobacillus pectinivorans]|uniref:PspC domain-containing protein n=1 Tax=Sporolactobacillus pectinivorans TaxID=1591408 RepID=UPI000C25762C|nr:PspC domain-containing protein [Sporolactobacillus pectinivorans]
MKKRLYRSRDNRVVAGILGGIGEYFNVDPTVIRVIFIVLLVASFFFPCTIGYILAYFIIPEQGE